MLGVKRGTVRLENYDSGWVKEYEAEKKRLENIFGTDLLQLSI